MNKRLLLTAVVLVSILPAGVSAQSVIQNNNPNNLQPQANQTQNTGSVQPETAQLQTPGGNIDVFAKNQGRDLNVYDSPSKDSNPVAKVGPSNTLTIDPIKPTPRFSRALLIVGIAIIWVFVGFLYYFLSRKSTQPSVEKAATPVAVAQKQSARSAPKSKQKTKAKSKKKRSSRRG